MPETDNVIKDLAGLIQLQKLPPGDVLILGVDLAISPEIIALKNALGAKIISFTEAPTPPGLEQLPKSLFLGLKRLGGKKYRAIIFAQMYRNLMLFGLLLKAHQHFVLRQNELKQISWSDVALIEYARIKKPIYNAWLTAQIPKPKGPGNDYSFIFDELKKLDGKNWPRLKASVIVPLNNCNNCKDVLAKTLAGLTLQTYPPDLFEVIVCDAGSDNEIETIVSSFHGSLNIRLVTQQRNGSSLAVARNLGLKTATGQIIVNLAADMLPTPNFLSAHLKWFHAFDGPLVTIGSRCDEAAKNLRTHPAPYALACGGNVAFCLRTALKASMYDEAFQTLDGEDFAYRLYRQGAYFVYEPQAQAYQQRHKPAATKAEQGQISPQLLANTVPHNCFYSPQGLWRVPKVSIYMPAFNAGRFIARAIDSALNQTLSDLEVCICNDGSSDNTLRILESRYAHNPKVRWVSQKQSGIAAASESAVKLCRGEYILQLDADDELLPEAALKLSQALDSNHKLSVASGGYELLDKNNQIIRVHVPKKFSALGHLLGNILSPPRMFRARDFYRTQGFFGQAAVDFDIGLKLAEVGFVKFVPEVLYRYHFHDQNLSLLKKNQQWECHLAATRTALARRGLNWKLKVISDENKPRVEFVPQSSALGTLWQNVRQKLWF